MKSLQIIIAALLIATVILPVGFAISQPLNDEMTVFIFIDSRFKLWDSNEKMLDNNFTVTILSIDNETHTYRISANNEIRTGNLTNLTYIHIEYFNITDSTLALHIEIDDKPIYTVSNIKLISDITASGISQIGKPFVISLSPFDWNKKQWNIFNSVIISALISVLLAYLFVLRFRKLHGTRVLT